MPETSMQNNRGSLRSASAACSLSLARTWGGTGGRTDAVTCLRCHQTKAQPMTARMAAAARVHQSQAQPLRISTGGLMARISFVRATGDGGGTISAELFVIIERKSRSAVEAAAFARFKKSAQRGGVGLIGAQLNEIDAHGAEQALQFLLRLGLAPREGGPFAGVTGVDLQDLAGFGILEHEPAQRRQFHFVSVGDVHAHDVVTAIGMSQRRKRGLGEAQRGGQARAREAGGGSGTMRLEKIRKHD